MTSRKADERQKEKDRIRAQFKLLGERKDGVWPAKMRRWVGWMPDGILYTTDKRDSLKDAQQICRLEHIVAVSKVSENPPRISIAWASQAGVEAVSGIVDLQKSGDQADEKMEKFRKAVADAGGKLGSVGKLEASLKRVAEDERGEELFASLTALDVVEASGIIVPDGRFVDRELQQLKGLVAGLQIPSVEVLEVIAEKGGLQKVKGKLRDYWRILRP